MAKGDLEVFCRSWSLRVMKELAGGMTRFNELKRTWPEINSKVLSETLKELCGRGLAKTVRLDTKQEFYGYIATDRGIKVLGLAERIEEA